MATLDQLAGGNRVILGIGLSGPQIVEGWYGQPWGRPNKRLRDYVTIMRHVLKREGPVHYEGEEISIFISPLPRSCSLPRIWKELEDSGQKGSSSALDSTMNNSPVPIWLNLSGSSIT